MERLIADPSALSLGGERRELTLFFSDIAGFTTISENLEPDKLAKLLTTLLSEITGIIQHHGGTVDKYVGDAVVAFWNAPLNQPDHARLAVSAALACQKRLAELNGEFSRVFGLSLKLRIGIHSGLVTVGNFGSKDRFNYTVVGDAANLASRLEGTNKHFGTDILISESTHALIGKSLPARSVGAVCVVGRKQSVNIFEPRDSFESDFLTSFERARTLFEDGFQTEALTLFRDLKDDPVSQAYVTRIERTGVASGYDPIWYLSDK